MLHIIAATNWSDHWPKSRSLDSSLRASSLTALNWLTMRNLWPIMLGLGFGQICWHLHLCCAFFLPFWKQVAAATDCSARIASWPLLRVNLKPALFLFNRAMMPALVCCGARYIKITTTGRVGFPLSYRIIQSNATQSVYLNQDPNNILS